MKRLILFLLILLLSPLVQAQDTTEVKFSEESDTIVKQSFIDRYENVFMTKVPTRHMLKIGLSQYYLTMPFALYNDAILSNTSLLLGYEYKFARAFSAAVSTQLPFLGTGVPWARTWNYTAIDLQIRWFFNMNKRIKAAKSANNFSGNYLAINYTYPGTGIDLPTAGFKLGFQHRFFNRGFMDFAVALQQQSPVLRYGLLKNWSLSSQASFGFGLGDWRRSSTPPLCDVFLCDQQMDSQWKVAIPDLTLGPSLSKVKLSIGFERKLGKLPASLNFQYDLGVLSGNPYLKINEPYSFPFLGGLYSAAKSNEIFQTFSLQPRYYFLQNRQRLKGTGGSGLSGLYTGVNSEYSLYYGRHQIRNFGPHYTKNIKMDIIRVGLLAGFQQRVFKHGYLDLNASYNLQTYLNTSKSNTGVRANLGIGFAF